MIDVMGDYSILVIRTGLVVTVTKRLSMTETTFYTWARKVAGKVHMPGWDDLVWMLI